MYVLYLDQTSLLILREGRPTPPTLVSICIKFEWWNRAFSLSLTDMKWVRSNCSQHSWSALLSIIHCANSSINWTSMQTSFQEVSQCGFYSVERENFVDVKLQYEYSMHKQHLHPAKHAATEQKGISCWVLLYAEYALSLHITPSVRICTLF